MSEIVDQGVASCPRDPSHTAPYKIVETDEGRLDSVISCPYCGRYTRKGIDDH